MCKQIDFKALRKKANLTLSELAELSGYNILHIYDLENGGQVAPCAKDKILSILLQRVDMEGYRKEVQHWRERALKAESKLEQLKTVVIWWVKKI